MAGQRRPLAWRVTHALIALAGSAALLGALAFGFGPLPALGPALDPGHGAWASAAGGQPVRSQELALSGLSQPVTVWFTGHGVPTIRAATDADAYLALGYLHARFRLTEMDLERRLGEGRVAQLAGPSAVSTDKFELRLGLLRTAQREWADTPPSSVPGQALRAYARGVNDYLAQVRASGQWPSVFALAGVYPRDWTPVDSLVLQGVLTQQLDYTTTPLDYALLERSLGPARTMAWFPVQAPGPQHPYDVGPYRKDGIAPLAGAAASTPAASTSAATTAAAAPVVGSTVPATTVPATTVPGSAVPATTVLAPTAAVTTGAGSTATAPAGGRAAPGGGRVSAGEAAAAAALLSETSALPAGTLHQGPDSNAWAANGPLVAGGKSMLAGDPHLPQTVPSVWYQAELSAPGLAVTGVTVPGLPGVLIGHNTHIAWSLTDVQDQATLFYTEQTSKAHPGQYFWRGAWHPEQQFHYTIPVAGAAPVQLTVAQTVHGPVMTQAGQTTSVDWMGNLPSPDLAVLLAVDKARDFAQFRSALSAWRAPTQNFVYADDRGNIGAISAGYYPVVRHGDPWLPLPGTGASDVAGVIPYRALPQVYNPPGHLVVTANQRPVGPSYPYYLGTSADFFDPGYRAGRISALLHGHTQLAPASFAAGQLDVTDALAQQVVPALLTALHSGSDHGHGKAQPGQALTAQQAAAAQVLAAWDYRMTPTSAGATLWWTFWGDYLRAVFQPWWDSARVPVSKDRLGLAVSPQQFSLDQMLRQWTLHDQGNAAFTPPGAARRTASQAMRSAFTTAVAGLTARLHGAPDSWAWGRVHRRQFPSVTQASGLGYGPRASGGDAWTVDAADGGLLSHAGPSWRMIVAWGSHAAVTAEGVYPGGQSENPASPWYQDQMEDWWDGRYLAMPPAGGYSSGPVRWSLRP